MSPISNLVIQRRAVETGRIRLGRQLVSRNGKKYPSKLDAFRFTTPSRRVADAVAAYLGGEVRRWEDAPAGEQWEVLTSATEIPVAIPPGDNAVSQWFELWSGGGCARRCDGVTETLKNVPCLCPSDPAVRTERAATGGACKPTTRVSVIIPDLPGIGIFRLESHGFYAAVELAGTAELLAAARGNGVIVPAVLRLEQRQVKRGGETKNFPVPVLEILPTLRELTGLEAGSAGLRAALPPAPGEGRALSAAPARAVSAAPAVPRAETAPAAGAAAGDDLAPPADAQALADLAATAGRELLLRLGRYARDRGWMDELVERDAAHEPLVEALRHRDEVLRSGPKAPVEEPPYLDAPPEEYDPTVSEPRDGPAGPPPGERVTW